MKHMTYDTGNDTDIFVGSLCVWLHKPVGGYGYTVSIPVKVLEIGKFCIKIEIEGKDGQTFVKYVKLQNLRWKHEHT